MASDYEVKRGIFGKSKVFYKCAKCENALKSDLVEAGSKDTCPFCKTVFVVPGQREFDEIQNMKKQEEENLIEHLEQRDREREAERLEAERRKAERKETKKQSSEAQRKEVTFFSMPGREVLFVFGVLLIIGGVLGVLSTTWLEREGREIGTVLDWAVANYELSLDIYRLILCLSIIGLGCWLTGVSRRTRKG